MQRAVLPGSTLKFQLGAQLIINPTERHMPLIQGGDNNSTLTGWTIGGGVEWLLNPNWSVKVEYLYYDFGLNDNWNATYCTISGGVCGSSSSYANWKVFNNDLTVNTVKLGVNYHLTSGYVPLK